MSDLGRLREAEENGDDRDTSSSNDLASKAPASGESAIVRSSSKQYSFPQFCRLPIELRRMIWQHFCPDLSRKTARIIDLELIRTAPITHTIFEGAGVADQTQALRAVLATHRESRYMALEFFPDTYWIREGRGLLRINEDRDKLILRFRIEVSIDNTIVISVVVRRL
ncbi:hypothetical protein F4821DRAFT_238174 [Hypoxylon rubiginosum]|uniref:Uncharacterized protein n=1 Tax=Hypoxylon rubiginosum TaxID=110542 RepID=A0ACC0D246_9PEZI|nr:hypothetical protein F4821DRAFT_238174 [Hypoxylon rubiginosum]